MFFVKHIFVWSESFSAPSETFSAASETFSAASETLSVPGETFSPPFEEIFEWLKSFHFMGIENT